MHRLWGFVALAVLISIAPVHADATRDQVRALQEQASAAYKAGKFADAAKNFADALTFRPHHPGLLYNFAATSAKAEHTTDAIRALNEYADMGLVADLDKDADFNGLKNLPAYKALLARLAANRKPIGTSTIAATISGPAFLAEGIAYDDVGKRFFISSVDQRKIVQISADGTTTDFVTSGRDGLLGAFGMAIDAKNQLLWASTSGVAQARALDPAEKGMGGTFAFSLKDGSFVSDMLSKPPAADAPRVIADLTVGPDGTVYATDSALPIIYAIPSPFSRPAHAEREWLKSGDFVSLQGIAATPDGKGLIAADYSMGLFFIDRATKAIQRVDYAGGTTLLGIDGLVRTGNTLIAVQNGIAPQRILAITLNATGSGVAAVKVISANDPNIPEPSLGTIKGGDFCVVANAQWSRFNDDGTRKADLDAPHIACISLK
jgi:sugar lactone lactonase YvrE